MISQPPKPSTATPIAATLRPAPPPQLEPPPLAVPETPPPGEQPTKPPRKEGKGKPDTWTQAIARHLKKLDHDGQFYPAEAIALNQQGEVLVLMIVDRDGKVSAARVEQSSGYPLLDAAALRAVRSLHSLPQDTPQEALLPVRFRLH